MSIGWNVSVSVCGYCSCSVEGDRCFYGSVYEGMHWSGIGLIVENINGV